LRCRGQLHAVEFDRGSFRNPATVTGKAHRRQPDGGLTGARFADQAHDLAAMQGQVYTVHDFDPLFIRVSFDTQILDVE
jgi:hypothetical protein